MVSRAGTMTGRADPDLPVQASCEVLARRREGAYWLLSLACPSIAERARPGQFINLAVGGVGTLLRRPFSIARVSKQGVAAGTVEVVFDAHGPGTEWLTTVDVHDVVDVVGPLGNPFPLPQRKVSCLLVGGGYGVAPLLYLADELTRKGLRVDMIIGAATQGRILSAIEAKRLTASVTFTTDDGSYGEHGRVTDVLEDVVQRCGSGVVYACGPNPMLRAVSEWCKEEKLPVQVAVEEHMACGIGVCFTCVMPMRNKNGIVRMKRACFEGPVFNGARIAWDQTRFEVGPALMDEVDVEEAEPVVSRPTDADLWGDA
jgi:dihydroorotate dehydrogenase electron transfer subunit